MKEYEKLNLREVCSLVAEYHNREKEIVMTNDDYDSNRGRSFIYEDILLDDATADDVIVCFDDGVGLPLWLIESQVWRVFIRS